MEGSRATVDHSSSAAAPGTPPPSPSTPLLSLSPPPPPPTPLLPLPTPLLPIPTPLLHPSSLPLSLSRFYSPPISSTVEDNENTFNLFDFEEAEEMEVMDNLPGEDIKEYRDDQDQRNEFVQLCKEMDPCLHPVFRMQNNIQRELKVLKQHQVLSNLFYVLICLQKFFKTPRPQIFMKGASNTLILTGHTLFAQEYYKAFFDNEIKDINEFECSEPRIKSQKFSLSDLLHCLYASVQMINMKLLLSKTRAISVTN